MIVSLPRRIAVDNHVPGLLVMLKNVFENSRQKYSVGKSFKYTKIKKS